MISVKVYIYASGACVELLNCDYATVTYLRWILFPNMDMLFCECLLEWREDLSLRLMSFLFWEVSFKAIKV